jgi:hypothetical protein
VNAARERTRRARRFGLRRDATRRRREDAARARNAAHDSRERAVGRVFVFSRRTKEHSVAHSDGRAADVGPVLAAQVRVHAALGRQAGSRDEESERDFRGSRVMFREGEKKDSLSFAACYKEMKILSRWFERMCCFTNSSENERAR